ncbi:hypothetical protein J3F83DRAFT_26081 [Trichoderma novae-zelandiae]
MAAVTRRQVQDAFQDTPVNVEGRWPMASGNGFSWHRAHNNQIVVVDPGHTLSRKDLRAPCPLDFLRSLLSGSDSKSFDMESRSSGAHERWGLPAEGRRFGFGGPRFLAPSSISLARESAPRLKLFAVPVGESTFNGSTSSKRLRRAGAADYYYRPDRINKSQIVNELSMADAPLASLPAWSMTNAFVGQRPKGSSGDPALAICEIVRRSDPGRTIYILPNSVPVCMEEFPIHYFLFSVVSEHPLSVQQQGAVHVTSPLSSSILCCLLPSPCELPSY